MFKKETNLGIDKCSYLLDFVSGMNKNTKEIEISLKPYEGENYQDEGEYSSNRNDASKKGKPALQPVAPQSLNLITKSTEADEIFNMMSEYNTLSKNYQGKRDHTLSNYG